MTVKSDSTKSTPQAQLRACIAKLDPMNQKLFRSVRTAVRKRFPTANELAYDYSHSLVVSYSPNERGIDAPVAIAARADGVFLYFNQGPRLPDLKKLLRGSGKQTRFVQVESAGQLAHPDVKALIAAAIDHATIPLPPKGKGSLIIKSDGAKKPTRRKPSK
jgi:hypothetical protein